MRFPCLAVFTSTSILDARCPNLWEAAQGPVAQGQVYLQLLAAAQPPASRDTLLIAPLQLVSPGPNLCLVWSDVSLKLQDSQRSQTRVVEIYWVAVQELA